MGGCYEKRGDQARREMHLRALDEWQADCQEDRGESNLQQGKWLIGNPRGDMAECNTVQREADGAAEGEDVTKVD